MRLPPFPCHAWNRCRIRIYACPVWKTGRSRPLRLPTPNRRPTSENVRAAGVRRSFARIATTRGFFWAARSFRSAAGPSPSLNNARTRRHVDAWPSETFLNRVYPWFVRRALHERPGSAGQEMLECWSALLPMPSAHPFEPLTASRPSAGGPSCQWRERTSPAFGRLPAELAMSRTTASRRCWSPSCRSRRINGLFSAQLCKLSLAGTNRATRSADGRRREVGYTRFISAASGCCGRS